MRKRRARIWQQLTLGLVALLLLSSSGCAGDGVIEINQASAMAGGVMVGDGPGYPVTIDVSGSYRLTGNLTVEAGTTAILIQTDAVSIDLNGFTIHGPGEVVEPGTGTGRGIDAIGQHHITAVNGMVRGVGAEGIILGDSARVERVRVTGNGSDGISVGADSLVVNNIATFNGLNGIRAGAGSTVCSNATEHNGNNDSTRCNKTAGVRVEGFNGVGSFDGPYILRFTSVHDGFGGLGWTPQPKPGDYLVIPFDGWYSFNFSGYCARSNMFVGFSLNAGVGEDSENPSSGWIDQPIGNLPSRLRLSYSMCNGFTTGPVSVNWSGFLNQGSVFRVHGGTNQAWVEPTLVLHISGMRL